MRFDFSSNPTPDFLLEPPVPVTVSQESMERLAFDLGDKVPEGHVDNAHCHAPFSVTPRLFMTKRLKTSRPRSSVPKRF